MSDKERDTILVIGLVAIILLWIYVISPAITWLQNHIIIVQITLIIILIGFIIVGYFYYKNTNRKKTEREAFVQVQKNKGLTNFIDRHGLEKWGSPEEANKWLVEDEEAKIKETKFNRIIESIEKFEPSRKYHNEFGYHIELQGWLKTDFPSASIEKTIGASRPDIVIDEIAIEVKGPTLTKDLVTLSDKCTRYSNYYKNIIIVLFEPNFSEDRFYEMKIGMEKAFPHVKIIRKN